MTEMTLRFHTVDGYNEAKEIMFAHDEIKNKIGVWATDNDLTILVDGDERTLKNLKSILSFNNVFYKVERVA